MDFMELVMKRCSTRAYDAQKEVPLELVQKCVQAAGLAPSACNFQPWYFAIVRGEKAAQLAPCVQSMGMNKFASDCTSFVVVFSRRDAVSKTVSAVLPDKSIQSIDIGLAVSQFCLEAAELGLSTCILGWLNEKQIQRLTGIDFPVRLVLCVGYEGANNKPHEKKRKSLEEIMTVVE